MYKPIEGGTKEVIMDLDCWVPPVPDKHEIANYHLPEKDQFWQREPLPTFRADELDWFIDEPENPDDEIDWDTARRQEIIKQTGADPMNLNRQGEPKSVSVDTDPEYRQSVLMDYRNQELDHINPWTGGYWFYNNGKPVYLTPFHYFYLQWWKMDSGYPEFNEADRKRFYAWQHVFEHPSCYGLIMAGPRGIGKTYFATAIQYLATIHTFNCNSAIQSKTDNDARDAVFEAKLKSAWRELPDFLVPMNAMSTDPKSGLFFFDKSKKGHGAYKHKQEKNLTLNSKIVYGPSKVKAFDGWTINGVFVRDEEGKTEEADVYERHNTVKDCVKRYGKLRGKILSTTTVDTLDHGGESYKKLYNASNQRRINKETGTTTSGCYKFFLPTEECYNFDKYGYPKIEENRAEINAERRDRENDPQALLKYILNNPQSEKELFKSNGRVCQYNYNILSKQQEITNEQSFIRVGNFVPQNGEFGNPVEWEDDEENGRWHVAYLFSNNNKSNRYSYYQSVDGRAMYYPKNSLRFVGGFDPTKSGNNTVDKRRSTAAGAIFCKSNYDNDYFDWNFVADYQWEPDDPDQAWYDFILGCLYYGCGFLPEINIGISYLIKSLGVSDFLLRMPVVSIDEEDEDKKREIIGMPSNGRTNNFQFNLKKKWVENHGSRLLLPRIIAQSISFDPAHRTQYDVEVGSQLALAATEVEPDDLDTGGYDLNNILKTA